MTTQTSQTAPPTPPGTPPDAALIGGVTATQTKTTTSELATAVRACDLTGFPDRQYYNLGVEELNAVGQRFENHHEAQVKSGKHLVGQHLKYALALAALCECRRRLFASPEFHHLHKLCSAMTPVERGDAYASTARALFYGRHLPLRDPGWAEVARRVAAPIVPSRFRKPPAKEQFASAPLPPDDQLKERLVLRPDPKSAALADEAALRLKAGVIALLEQNITVWTPELTAQVEDAWQEIIGIINSRRALRPTYTTFSQTIHCPARKLSVLQRTSTLQLPRWVSETIFGCGTKLQGLSQRWAGHETAAVCLAAEAFREDLPSAQPHPIVRAAWNTNAPPAPEMQPAEL